MYKRTILNNKHFELTLNRLCYEVIENHKDFFDTVFIGLQPRGVKLAEILQQRITKIIDCNIQIGKLDVTFYRDDFRRNKQLLKASETDINFIIENKNVILIDDVLYTGRTIRSALDALLDFGRPNKVELLVLIDRRFSRHLPIQPNYFGKKVDTMPSERVKVTWEKNNKNVKLISINS